MNLSIAARVACVAFVAALSFTGAPAEAIEYSATNAGGACHAANGGAAAKFVWGNHYLTNNNSTDQYVICQFQMADPTASENIVDYLSVNVTSPGPGATITCVAQTGSYYDATLFIRASVVRSYTFVNGGSGYTLEWQGVLTRTNVDDVLTLNCKLPPGMRMGLISRGESTAP